MEGANVTEEGTIFCWGKQEGCRYNGKGLLKIPKSDCRRCNLIADCDSGFDEANCPPYVAPSFELPIYCTLVFLLLGILFHLGWQAVTKAAEEEIKAREDNFAIHRQLEEAVDLIVQAAVQPQPQQSQPQHVHLDNLGILDILNNLNNLNNEQRWIPESAYTLVHDTPGGIEVLVGASFLFSLEPAAKHRLALAIKEQEKKRHGNEWRSCVRRKAGSTKASAIFLDSLKPPGFLKKASFKASEGLRWLSDPPAAEEPDTWYGQIWSKAKSKLVNGFPSFLKTTSFIIDYVKDTFFFAYLFQKQDVITSLFIKHLITMQGLTILSQGVITGLMIQFDNNVIDLESFAYPNYVWIVRVIIFVATPVMPVFVILRALRLSSEKRKLEAEWRRNQESISKSYLRYNKLDRKKRKVMTALADMKMVEVSTEGVPQLYILTVLIWASSNNQICAGITFLQISRIQTFMTIILSVIGSINLRKGGQLDIKAKILLGSSLSCQMGARLLVMVAIAMAAIRQDISISTAALLLLLPIVIGWASSILLHKILNTDFFKLSTKGKLVHLLSTTWFTLPVRRLGERDQRHKAREMTFGFILAAVNLLGTFCAFFKYADVLEIEAIYLVLPLPLFLIGCGLLRLFDMAVHPWRQLGKEREEEPCWGKLKGSMRGIEAEPTLWEQV